MLHEETNKEREIRKQSEVRNPYSQECNNRQLWSEGFRIGYHSKLESEMKKNSVISPETEQRLFNYFEQEHGIQLMVSDFNEIQNYVRPDMEQIAKEFAGWMALRGKPYSNNGILKHWKYLSYQSNDIFTTNEMFEKFMEERGQG